MAREHWLEDSNGNFDNARNWSGGVVPGSENGVVLDAPGEIPYTVTASSSETVQFVTTKADATLAISSGTFTAAEGTGAGVNHGTIRIGNQATLAVAGELDNAGTIVMGNYGVMALNGPVTLSGGGLVTAGEESAIAGRSQYLTNIDNTIEGPLAIFEFVNQSQGVIISNSTGGTGELYIGGYHNTNYGLMEATNGADLTFTGGTTINDGTIAANGGVVHFYNAGSGSGIISIKNGDFYLENFIDKSSVGWDVDFTGKKGRFLLAEIAGQITFSGSITGLSDHGGNFIDLIGVVYTSATYAGNDQGGTLSIYTGDTLDGTIALNGDYMGDTFSINKNGEHDYKVVIQPQEGAPALHRFAAAAAALTVTGTTVGHSPDGANPERTMLAAPHTALA